jgi:hypothetical protein
MAATRDDELTQHLRAVEEASPFDRIEHRDAIAAMGAPAIEAMEDWLGDPDLCRFAMRTIGRAGQLGEPEQAIAALLQGREMVPSAARAEVDFELERLGHKPPKSKKPSKPSWAKDNPYDVPKLRPDSGLSWPGFQAHEFGDVTGTIWRRRDDPASLPPLLLRPLREIHPHFSSWSIYRSAEVHLAITDRYQQFDQRESGWRAAKLVVYAHGPSQEHPTMVAQAVAGLYIEKGDGADPYGPVDARWDWPRVVSSLTDPATSQPLAAVMERHDLRFGDFVGQRFGPTTQIGGVGRMQDGEFVFSAPDGTELFRGFAAMRHHLEQLPATDWHDMHIWRAWSMEEAVKAGPAFATASLTPVLVDLARIYIAIVKDAVAAGVRALHRVVERHTGANGTEQIVALIQAHSQPGHLTLPKQVMDELGIPVDGRVSLKVESLEGENYYEGEMSIRSGTEIYFRVSDEETKGLDRIEAREWIRVRASRPRGIPE